MTLQERLALIRLARQGVKAGLGALIQQRPQQAGPQAKPGCPQKTPCPQLSRRTAGGYTISIKP